MEARKINYYVKSVYGIERFYIHDPREARNFQQLTRDKTVSINHMKAFEELTGIEFQQILPQNEMPM